jgi:hypothetical protein
MLFIILQPQQTFEGAAHDTKLKLRGEQTFLLLLVMFMSNIETF